MLILSAGPTVSRTTALDAFSGKRALEYGELSADEVERLETRYQQQDPRAIAPASRDWALIWWDSVPREALR